MSRTSTYVMVNVSPRSRLTFSSVLAVLPLLYVLLATLSICPCDGIDQPSAPIGVQGSGTEATATTIRWVPDKTDSVTSYVIQYREEPSNPNERRGRVLEQTDIRLPFYRVERLKPNTFYSFQVLSVNSHGRSRPSNAIRIKTAELGTVACCCCSRRC